MHGRELVRRRGFVRRVSIPSTEIVTSTGRALVPELGDGEVKKLVIVDAEVTLLDVLKLQKINRRRRVE